MLDIAQNGLYTLIIAQNGQKLKAGVKKMKRARATERDRLVEYFEKRIIKDVSSSWWKWNDGILVWNFSSRVNNLVFGARFEAKGCELRSVIESKQRYGIEEESETFDSSLGIEVCARWTAEKLAQLCETVLQRIAPYLEKYEQALRGAI